MEKKYLASLQLRTITVGEINRLIQKDLTLQCLLPGHLGCDPSTSLSSLCRDPQVVGAQLSFYLYPALWRNQQTSLNCCRCQWNNTVLLAQKLRVFEYLMLPFKSTWLWSMWWTCMTEIVMSSRKKKKGEAMWLLLHCKRNEDTEWKVHVPSA